MDWLNTRINALEITIFEEPKPEEETIKISLDEEKLYFDFDDSMVKPRYDEVLKETVKIIKNNNYKLKIYAYTDSKGTPSYNEKLSLMRAESVKSKLIQLGLDSEDLLEVKGMGNSNPIAPNKKSDGTDNPEGRALNRRIELILIK